ncbi:hypothetical protein F4703DRAFT_1927798 [Phycomyces blakesleeanus]
MSSTYKRSLLDRVLRRNRPNQIERVFDKDQAKALARKPLETTNETSVTLQPPEQEALMAHQETEGHSGNQPSLTIDPCPVKSYVPQLSPEALQGTDTSMSNHLSCYVQIDSADTMDTNNMPSLTHSNNNGEATNSSLFAPNGSSPEDIPSTARTRTKEPKHKGSSYFSSNIEQSEKKSVIEDKVQKIAFRADYKDKENWNVQLLPEPFVRFDPFKGSPLFQSDPPVDVTLSSAAIAIIDSAPDTSCTADIVSDTKSAKSDYGKSSGIKIENTKEFSFVPAIESSIQAAAEEDDEGHSQSSQTRATTSSDKDKKSKFPRRWESINTRIHKMFRGKSAQDASNPEAKLVNNVPSQPDQLSIPEDNRNNAEYRERVNKKVLDDVKMKNARPLSKSGSRILKSGSIYIDNKEYNDALVDQLASVNERLPARCLVREGNNTIQFTFRKPRQGKLLRFACWAEPFSLDPSPPHTDPLGHNCDDFQIYESDGDGDDLSGSNGSASNYEDDIQDHLLRASSCQTCVDIIHNMIPMTTMNEEYSRDSSIATDSYYTAFEYLPSPQEIRQGWSSNISREGSLTPDLCLDPNAIMNDFQSRYIGVSHPLKSIYNNHLPENSQTLSKSGKRPNSHDDKHNHNHKHNHNYSHVENELSTVVLDKNEILGRDQMVPNDDRIIKSKTGQDVRRNPNRECGSETDRLFDSLYDEQKKHIPQDPSCSKWYLDPLYRDI